MDAGRLITYHTSMSESLSPVITELEGLLKRSFTAVPPADAQQMPPGAMPPGAMPPGAMPPEAMPPGAMPPEAMPPEQAAPPSAIDPELINLLTTMSNRIEMLESEVSHDKELRKARENAIKSQTSLAE